MELACLRWSQGKITPPLMWYHKINVSWSMLYVYVVIQPLAAKPNKSINQSINAELRGIAEFAGLENDGLDVSKQQARLTEVNDGDE